jgi:hypothetical protein
LPTENTTEAAFRLLLGLEEKDRTVAQVKVNEVFGLVCDKGAEVASYDTVPGRAFSLVELYRVRFFFGCGKSEELDSYCFLDVLCDVLQGMLVRGDKPAHKAVGGEIRRAFSMLYFDIPTCARKMLGLGYCGRVVYGRGRTGGRPNTPTSIASCCISSVCQYCQLYGLLTNVS